MQTIQTTADISINVLRPGDMEDLLRGQHSCREANQYLPLDGAG
jgi:hypothetical protein